MPGFIPFPPVSGNHSQAQARSVFVYQPLLLCVVFLADQNSCKPSLVFPYWLNSLEADLNTVVNKQTIVVY